ncbi:MAG: GDCCVxC domain-containing (seleno)protein [Chloroflexota bacterium]
METLATLTCPACGQRTTETMPMDACLYFYTCPRCGTRVRPRPGDCCVFCSYGNFPCQPKQATGESPAG